MQHASCPTRTVCATLDVGARVHRSTQFLRAILRTLRPQANDHPGPATPARCDTRYRPTRLNIEVGAPVLRVERTAYTFKDTPVEYRVRIGRHQPADAQHADSASSENRAPGQVPRSATARR
nr:UTRA domain-containing protein [Paraburkholderia rhizosphaerae]